MCTRRDLMRPVSFLPLDFTITMAASKKGHPAVHKNSTGPGFSIRIAPRKSVVEMLDELDHHASRDGKVWFGPVLQWILENPEPDPNTY